MVSRELLEAFLAEKRKEAEKLEFSPEFEKYLNSLNWEEIFDKTKPLKLSLPKP